MFCPTCKAESPTVRVELHGAGNPVKMCSKGHAIEERHLAQVQGPSANGFVDEEGVPVQFTFAPPPPQRVAAPAKAPVLATLEKLAARDSLKDIKARRRAIAVEIKRLTALHIEDDELAAAERAIEGARRSKKVRPLRNEVAS